MATIEVTEKNIEETLQKDGIVLIDFWAEWCGPCKAFGPTFEAASNRYPDITFGKVDTEAQGGLAQAFQVRSIPMLAAFRDGIMLFSQPGALPGEAVDELVVKLQELDMEEIRTKIAEEAKDGAKA